MCSVETSHHPECVQSILLCAPTLSYCRQLAETVEKSLEVLHLWMEPVSAAVCQAVLCHEDVLCVKVLVHGEARLVSVCGGGAWEMALAKLMDEHIQANTIHKFVS